MSRMKSVTSTTTPMAMARSSTRGSTRRPRTLSMTLKKMWPPSKGRKGSRLMMPRLTDRKASRIGYQLWRTAVCDIEMMPTGPAAPSGPTGSILPLTSIQSPLKVAATMLAVWVTARPAARHGAG